MSEDRTRSGPGRTRGRGTRWALRAVGALCAVAALAPAGAAAATNADRYAQRNLESDLPGVAEVTNPHLINPWGLSAGGLSFLWTANEGDGTSSLLGGAIDGVPPFTVPLVVSIPGGHPTGTVFHSGSGFEVVPHAPAMFLFDSMGGTISGWTPFAGLFSARTVHTTPGAVYTGLAISGERLYAANLASGRIDVFDSHFAPVDVGTGFTDPNLPAGYAPFNVQTLGDRVYVAWVKAENGEEQPGPGVGAVDVFTPEGQLVKRLVTGGALNAPWGLAIAPSRFGAFSGDLLVGNFGDGAITAYDPSTGAAQGALKSRSGAPIHIDGLWALRFGNGFFGSRRSLIFSAGIAEEAHGLVGSLDAIHP